MYTRRVRPSMVTIRIGPNMVTELDEEPQVNRVEHKHRHGLVEQNSLFLCYVLHAILKDAD